MSERRLTFAEKRRIAAINKALIYGMDFCDEEEKRLIRSYIVMKTVRIDPSTESNATDDLFEAAMKRSKIEMRREDAESCN